MEMDSYSWQVKSADWSKCKWVIHEVVNTNLGLNYVATPDLLKTDFLTENFSTANFSKPWIWGWEVRGWIVRLFRWIVDKYPGLNSSWLKTLGLKSRGWNFGLKGEDCHVHQPNLGTYYGCFDNYHISRTHYLCLLPRQTNHLPVSFSSLNQQRGNSPFLEEMIVVYEWWVLLQKFCTFSFLGSIAWLILYEFLTSF